jgi:DNA invertase Pin-like site-specific DNA recombinase
VPAQYNGVTAQIRKSTAKPLQAVTYGRVSTGRQADSGLGLDDQAELVTEACRRRGFKVVGDFVDPGKSGKRKVRRPGLEAALAMLDDGDADVLVCAKVDRLSRSTTDMGHILDRAQDHGWSIVLLDVGLDTSTASGRLMADVLVSMAAFESNRIAERVRAAHHQKRVRGQRSGRRPELPDDVRQRIFRERAEGRTLRAIAEDLTAEGVPTPRGGKWHAVTISSVVKSVLLDQELASVH